MPPMPPFEEDLRNLSQLSQLTDDELMELDRFLASPGLVESSLDVFGLEGFFAAVVATPRLVEPSEWTPWIWDVDAGEISPEFESPEQEERILGLVLRLHDDVAAALAPEAGEFEPLFEEGDAEAAANWCSGFLAGTRFESDMWGDLIDERPKWFAPILGLGLEDEDGPRPRKGQIERWTRDVGPSVARIHGFWLAQRQGGEPGSGAESLPAGLGSGTVGGVRAERAPGRNDPCACGSGRKYKRCCGAAAAGSS